jgi:hypothetical protein
MILCKVSLDKKVERWRLQTDNNSLARPYYLGYEKLFSSHSTVRMDPLINTTKNVTLPSKCAPK